MTIVPSQQQSAPQPAAVPQKPPVKQTSFKADLIYGVSGTYKTSQIGRAALWYYKRTGKKSRLITADPGGFEPIQALIDEGILDVWVILQEEFFIEAATHACQGRWPKEVNGKRVFVMTTPEEWNGIAMVGIEGLTSIGDGIIKRLRDTRAKLGQDPSYTFNDGAAQFAGSNPSYYGFAQDNIRDLVKSSSMLPCDKIIWTALEGKGEEEGGSHAPTFGPSIAGKKSIGKAGQWFGNMIHMEMLSKSEKDAATGMLSRKDRVVMYLRPHNDPVTQVPFPAKTRAPFQFAHEVPDYMEPEIEKLYEQLENLQEKARDRISSQTQAVKK